MISKYHNYIQQVVAIITTMTDLEQPFVHDIVESVAYPGISQVVVFCIEQYKIWIETLIQQADAKIFGSDFVEIDHYLMNKKENICPFTIAQYILMPSLWMPWTEVYGKLEIIPVMKLLFPSAKKRWCTKPDVHKCRRTIGFDRTA